MNNNMTQSTPLTAPNNMTEGSLNVCATNLIQSLDEALSDMTSLTYQAEQDAKEARNNAKFAVDIARRYSTRCYEQNKNTFKSSSIDNDDSFHRDGDDEGSAIDNDKIKYVTDDSPVRPPAQSVSPLSHYGKEEPKNVIPLGYNLCATSSTEKDVLSMTLELERTKQALHSISQEFMEQKSKIAELDNEINRKEQNIYDLEDQIQIAEDDANMAMDVAKQSSEKREEVEKYLKLALKEISDLKQKLEIEHSNKEKDLEPIQECEESTSTRIIVRPKESSKAVNLGRGILQYHLQNRTPHHNNKSAYKKLQDAMYQNNTKFVFSSEQTEPLSSRHMVHSSSMPFHEMRRIIQDSSTRLNMKINTKTKISKEDFRSVESMMTSYCHCVEKKMNHQKLRSEELNFYCQFLEKSIATNAPNSITERE